MNSRDHIIFLMSNHIYEYKENIISFRINGIMKPYFYLSGCMEFEQLKTESNKLRTKEENPYKTLAKQIKPFL